MKRSGAEELKKEDLCKVSKLHLRNPRDDSIYYVYELESGTVPNIPSASSQRGRKGVSRET